MEKSENYIDELPQDKARRQHPNQLRPAGSVVPDLLRSVKGFDLMLAQLLSGWASIVGSPLDRFTLPEKIMYNGHQRETGTLLLRVTGSAALDVQHLTPQILEKLNGFFGYRCIEGIKIVQGPIPMQAAPTPKKPEKPLSSTASAELSQQLDTVTDPDLRQSLQKLGKHIFTS